MRPMVMVLVLCAASAGCILNHGPDADDMLRVPEVKGRAIEVQLHAGAGAPSTTWSGELLEVRDSSLVLLADTVIVAHFSSVRRVTVAGPMPVLSGSENEDYRRRRPGLYLHHASRYPYGAPAEVMHQIRRDRGQAAPQSTTADTTRATADAGPFVEDARAGTARAPVDAGRFVEDARAGTVQAPVDAGRFVEDARAGTQRYRERRYAIADGYRRLGPAFPGMGEHWVHPGLIVNGRFDARTPSVLCYADSAGVPTLVGVAYAVSVLSGESPPPSPAGPDIWHEHSDAVDDETLLLVHPAAHHGDASQPRLAMFHAWIWLDNPDGEFVQNNWALPFALLGLEPATGITAAAAQAASLLTVGEPYYMQLLEVLAAPDDGERRVFQGALAAAGERARTWHSTMAAEQVEARDVAVLERIWTDLWHALDAAAAPATRTRLSRYAGRPGHMSH